MACQTSRSDKSVVFQVQRRAFNKGLDRIVSTEVYFVPMTVANLG